MTPAEKRLIDAIKGREVCYARFRQTSDAVTEATNAREDVYSRARDAADKAYDAIVDADLENAAGQENPANVKLARSEQRDASAACRLSEKEYEAALKALLEESDD